MQENTSHPPEHDPFFQAVQDYDEARALAFLRDHPSVVHSRTKRRYGGHLGGEAAEATHGALNGAATEGMVELVRELLDQGADIRTRGMFGQTPLHDASWYGQGEVAKLLVQRGAPLDATCKSFGLAPFFWAIHGAGQDTWAGHHDQAKVAQLLLDNGFSVAPEELAGFVPEFEPYFSTMAEFLAKQGFEVKVKDEGEN